ncbi:MAG: hypothetical protein IKV02_02315 [Clostridia bacterium]|nr:hypothetical protein [Clostridia bacterium]
MTKTKLKKDGFITSFLEGWRALVTLVKMQLKEKMDLGYLRSKRQLVFKTTWLFIEFAAITAIIAVIFHFIKLLGLFSLVHDIPVSVISLAFGVMLLLSLITDTIGLVKSLYFSKDNTVLLTFPATPSLVFLSKLVTYYVYEFRKNFMFTIPMFIAYGLIVRGYGLSDPKGLLYYPWLVLMFVLISSIPVLLAALLSIPAMFIYIFLNRVKVLQYLLYSALGGGAILLVWWLIGLLPENINFIETWGDTYWQIQAFLDGYVKTFAPIYEFTELIVGRTVGLSSVIFHSGTVRTLLMTVALGIGLLLMCLLCSKPLFCRMASTPFEFKKKDSIKWRKNYKLPTAVSAIKKEFVIGVRSNAFIKLGGILVVIMPMAIYLLNKLYSAMDTRFIGTQMTICFNIVIILLIMLMTNIDIASVYSRDGSSSYLNKVQPTPYATLLFSKLIFPMIIALVGLVFTVNVFAIEAGLAQSDAILMGVMIYGVYIAHLFSSAESDIMNPQYEQYATFNEQANNPNETGSGVSAILFSAIVFAIAFFLSSRNDTGIWLKLAIVAICLAVFKVFTYLSKIKAFYKEKQ